MTRKIIRQEKGAFNMRRNRSLGAFRRLRVSFVRPRTVGFAADLPQKGSAQEHRIEIRWPEAQTDKTVRVRIIRARPLPVGV